jgi:hypothetical protein
MGVTSQCVGVNVFCEHEPQHAGDDPSFTYNIWCAKFYLRHPASSVPKPETLPKPSKPSGLGSGDGEQAVGVGLDGTRTAELGLRPVRPPLLR